MKAYLTTILLLICFTAVASEPVVYGPRLEGFEYPFPVQTYTFASQQQSLEMAYLDVKPKQANGRTVVLLHGKNFCAATWVDTIKALSAAGYRVVAPDQIGFCKSSKPPHYQFSFVQLASNTHALLESLGIKKVTVMGHSMGGMLATRFGLMYPEQTEQLVLVNPIGLEDWKAVGVPSRTVDDWYSGALKTSAEGMRNYQQHTYYAGSWRPEFDQWVEMQAGMYRGKGREANAWSSALTSDMIWNQPVVYEFPLLTMPVLLLIGELDNTAIGKDRASPALRKKLGDYPKLAQTTKNALPNARLIGFADLGHSPQIQAPARFHKALLEGLKLKP